MRRLAVGLLLLAGCAASAPPPPPVAAPAPPPDTRALAAIPEDPLAEAHRLFEAGRYLEAAALAHHFDGREAEELTATAWLAAGRELNAMTAYEQLAKRYPQHPGYAQVHRALHNGFVVKRADHYLNRATVAFNRGDLAESAMLVETALDALYSQKGSSPDPRRLQKARDLMAALHPPGPARPAPPAVRLSGATAPAPPREAAYPKAVPRRTYTRAASRLSVRRPSVRRPSVLAVAPPPVVTEPAPRPRRTVHTFVPQPKPRSRVESLRAGESLLQVRGATFESFQGQPITNSFDYPTDTFYAPGW